ncbi:MAG: ABC transporter ATP-binding protein [Mediterranea massiliensis]|nr:ABC transporter ATP-binding protein [Mediterranea massiliensis]
MLKRIFRLLSPTEKRRGGWIALSVLLRAILDFAGVAALIPILILLFNQNPDRMQAMLLCGAVLVFILLKNGFVMLLARFQSRFLLELYRNFSRRMFINYYHRGLLFLKSKSSVQLGHEVNFVCYAFSLGILSPLFRLVGETLLLLMMVSALIIWEPLSGLLLCLGFLPLVIFYIGVARKRLRRYGAEELEARRQQSRTVVEAFRGYSELEISQAFTHSLASFDNGLLQINHNRLRMETLQLLPTCLSEIAIIVGLALLMLTSDGNLGVMSGVFAVAAYRMIPAVRGILNSWASLQNAAYSIKVVADGIEDNSKQPETDEAASFSFKEKIEIKQLGFTYPDGTHVFSNLSIEIKQGERVGVKGISGSGKSTLFNLLLGFYPPTEGKVLIDGRLLTTSNRSKWHKLVGYVPQEIFIMQGTLAENIAMGQKIDSSKLHEVLQQVQLTDWVKSLPLGIETSLGEYGNRLSGGQKQRIGIARALYKNAEILFFDEATSALDNHTEQEINIALQQLSEQHRELTLIIIAHRESSLKFCNKIIEINP